LISLIVAKLLILAILAFAVAGIVNLSHSISFVPGIVAKMWQIPIACLPLMVYAILGLKFRAYLGEVPPDQQQLEADKPQSASLTLAGFCFTSLSLLVSFFKEAIQHGEPGPENIILFFCGALTCFIASYMALRSRTQNLFLFMSDAFIDNGFWCVLVGLLTFLGHIAGMRRPAVVVTLLLVFYAGCVALHFRHFISYVTNPNRPHG
jgi:hypothetical protein